MFLRTVKVKRPGGRVDEYIRLVESVWRQGRPEHRIVANLGRKDLLAPHADTLRRLLTGGEAPGGPATPGGAAGGGGWGPGVGRPDERTRDGPVAGDDLCV